MTFAADYCLVILGVGILIGLGLAHLSVGDRERKQ